MPKPVCVPCGLFFRPTRNGRVWEEGIPHGGGPLRYYDQKEGTNWKSYKLWQGDEWTCKGCGTKIIVGSPPENFAEHYQSNYETIRDAFGGNDIPFVHDC